MRVSYIPPSSKHFDGVFASPDISRGGALGDIRVYKPNYHPRGGSIFGFLMRTALPFVRRIIAPEFGSFVKNVASDVENKTPFRQSIKKKSHHSYKKCGTKNFERGEAKKEETREKEVYQEEKNDQKEK